MISRRDFSRRVFSFGLALPVLPSFSLQGAGANNTLRAAVMGTNGRGLAHIDSLLAQKNVQIAYVCDVDERALKKGLDQVAKKQSSAARPVKDIRRVLEDKDVDLITIAAPNHWHAPAAILACQAGKHVYVEKPGSHNAWESFAMAQAATLSGKQVQLGVQRRSWPWIQEAMHFLHGGGLGRLTYARAWYNNARGSIGRGKSVPVPKELDFDLWQGPAPRRSYKDNLVHYNWHWHWHWGGGELANNGVHALDLVRWGLQVDAPTSVTCQGGRYYFQDDQETPDTAIATFQFGTKGAAWEGHSCDVRGPESGGFGVTFYGEGGSLVIGEKGITQYDGKNKEVKNTPGAWDDQGHFRNFLEGIRENKKLNAPIQDTFYSALLCHLGNIAYRTASQVELQNGKPTAKEARALWKRKYQKGWEPHLSPRSTRK